jgi:serine/threonine protein kinase
MTNRAHHPADRGSGEFTKDAPDAPGAGESASGAVDEAVSREFALPLDAERVLARAAEAADEDDDAEEVVLEPDSSDAMPSSPVDDSRELEGRADTVAAEAEGALASGGANPSGGDAAEGSPPSPLMEASSEPAARAAVESAPKAAVATVASADPGATEASPPGPRRVSQPPPLPAALELEARELQARELQARELQARELQAPRGDFTGTLPAEVTAAELEREASAEGPALAAPAAEGAKRPSFRAPFVDEVPDPVTPYEQRISETVKVADLPPVDQLRGRVLANRYLAEEVAEHTACSISYRSYHLALDRAVTVRVLLRGLACTDDAAREVRRIAAEATALEHPHVGATLDFGVLSDGWPFVVTEHFQGNTLATLLSKEGKFVLRRVLHVGKQLAQGLAAAHEKGIAHGLFSPDNVLVVEPGSSAEVVRILGFGVSRARGQQPGPPRSGVFGVPFYVSPEQAACRTVDVRSDIYSLGVILYELMTGAPPFSDGDFAGVLCQHLDDDAPPPSTRLQSPGALAKALDAIIERCLRKEPEKRYQTAAELADDLVRLEAAAARTKRRPMPEVQKPTSTIHSPHRKADAPEVPGAKVIVHDDVDEDVASPEPPEVAARRSSPSLTSLTSPPAAAPRPPKPGTTTPPSGNLPPSAPRAPSRSPSASGPGGKRPSNPPPLTAGASAPRPVRVRVDQATIKISAVDRARLLNERPGNRGSWLSSVVAAIRRFLAAQPDGSDDTR